MNALRLAYFVSPHGFGHATRSSAVMQACRRLDPRVAFDIYAGTPRWLFEQSLGRQVPFRHVPTETDVGLRQVSALEIDLPATVAALDAFLRFDPREIERLAAGLVRDGCRGVLCDVSPLGLEVARVAGLPSFLIENFTWDWIYETMLDAAPGLGRAIERLRAIYAGATHRIQTLPVCLRVESADLVVPPVGRAPRATRAEARAALDLPAGARVVLVTLGGMQESMSWLPRLRARGDVAFVVTGVEATARDGNLWIFDNATPLYMPDLICAADALVAKLGYSTLAEAWQQGRPLARVTRSGFRESPVLDAFAASELPGFAVSDDEFRRGDWIDRLPELLALESLAPRASNGADTAARFVLGHLHDTDRLRDPAPPRP